MENEIKTKKNNSLAASIVVAALILAGAWIYTNKTGVTAGTDDPTNESGVALAAEVLPAAGVTLPVRWGDLGSKLVESGVIDSEKIKALYANRPSEKDELDALLLGTSKGRLKITSANAGVLLNLLWALGLGNKNAILETGPMSDPQYGGAGNFASTGGWSLARGDAMDHYSQHALMTLTPAQQQMVERVSKNIYRPCCGNSTHFPDCNHGLAMLGLLQLMAVQGVSEAEMYRAALQVNAYWFPDTYLTIATYMQNKGVDWSGVKPEEMLGYDYSSGAGFAKIASQVTVSGQQKGGGGCSV